MEAPMRLLTRGNPKTLKGQRRGWHTAILHLAPAETAGIVLPSGRLFNACANAGNCKDPCLNTAGRGGIGDLRLNRIQQARKARTELFVTAPDAFFAQLVKELQREERWAVKHGYHFSFRPDGTSDLPTIATRVHKLLPNLRMYDYTKLPKPWLRASDWYHLTYSWDGPRSWPACREALAHGVNVAVPFRVCDHGTTCHCPLPTAWRGVRVVDGDRSDLRFLDPVGVIVGLRAKGRARSDAAMATGFTVDVRNHAATAAA
jgi:hypothetical protein